MQVGWNRKSYKRCPSCGGTGMSSGHKLCIRCGGYGSVALKVINTKPERRAVSTFRVVHKSGPEAGSPRPMNPQSRVFREAD